MLIKKKKASLSSAYEAIRLSILDITIKKQIKRKERKKRRTRRLKTIEAQMHVRIRQKASYHLFA